MTQKTRNELKELFKTGAKPSGDDFKAFIDSTLNVTDDGIAKATGADTPLKINAQGTDEKLLDFYTGETKTWSINQKPSEETSGLNIATPGGSKLFIDSSSGNVGIGTTSPGAKLEVNGNTTINGNLQTNSARIDNRYSSYATFSHKDCSSGSYALTQENNGTTALNAATGKKIFFRINDYTKMVLASTGRVGIGTAEPNAKLEVNGNLETNVARIDNRHGGSLASFSHKDCTAGTSYALAQSDDGTTYLNALADQNINFVINGNSVKMTVDSSGNVGIGTTEPNAKLEVNGNLETNVARIDNRHGGSLASFSHKDCTAGTSYALAQSDDGTTYLNAPTDKDIHFVINGNSIKMTVDSSGNVGIGTTSPEAKLDVRGYIYHKGLYNNSDLRIKEVKGVSDSKSDLNVLRQINITDYTYKDKIANDDKPHKKVIGQQIAEVFPQAVKTHTDEVPDILQSASITNGWVNLCDHGLQVGERVKLILEKSEPQIYTIEAVTPESFQVSLDHEGEVFVYGREVNDFHVVDYEALSMLNVSATQELCKIIDALKIEVKQLKTQVNGSDRAIFAFPNS